MKRLLVPLLPMLLFWLLAPGPGQAPPSGRTPQGLESLTPEERARIQENLERWKQLPPEERQRLREALRERRERGEARPRPGNGGGAPHPRRPRPPE